MLVAQLKKDRPRLTWGLVQRLGASHVRGEVAERVAQNRTLERSRETLCHLLDEFRFSREARRQVLLSFDILLATNWRIKTSYLVAMPELERALRQIVLEEFEACIR